jgi:hypothetical protein
MEDGLGGHLEKRHLQVDTPTSRISSFLFLIVCYYFSLLAKEEEKRLRMNLKSTYLICTVIPGTRVENLLFQASNQQVRYQIFTVRYWIRYYTYLIFTIVFAIIILSIYSSPVHQHFQKKQCDPKLTLALVVVDRFLKSRAIDPFYKCSLLTTCVGCERRNP